jgi:hypothetical protein
MKSGWGGQKHIEYSQEISLKMSVWELKKEMARKSEGRHDGGKL